MTTTTAAGRRAEVSGAAAFATLLTAITACIHASLVSEYVSEWPPAGMFVALVAVAQAAYASFLLRRPTVPVALAGIAANLGLVGLWIVTRNVGLPIGAVAPEAVYGHGTQAADPASTLVAGVPQAAGALDMTAAALHLAVVAALVSLLPGRLRRSTVNGLFALGVALVAVRVALVA